ncbi:MAG: DUF3262 family protein [Pseudoxanthomonas sp.]|jgi:hypothetical protein|nr:DUF3262 family protein [Pseudoxanthomonas sp.]
MMRRIFLRGLARKLLSLPPALLFATVALAAVVTAAQVAEAIRNSPNATPWLRANADSVGSLAMFESGGRTDVYNGSCCYGVLQMNEANISQYTNVSPVVFRTWSLEQQANAWSKLTSDAMNNQIVRGFIAMGTFDNRPVDGSMVLACVQLGIGNCQKMIKSGSCSGFADANGTTICAMANQIAGQNPGTGTNPTNPTPPGTGTGIGTGAPSPGISYNVSCVRDASGACVSMSQAIKFGFASGSGVSMSQLRSTIQLLLVAVTLLVVGSAMTGVWQNYARGAITKADMIHYMQRGLVIVGMVFVVMTVL